MINLQVTKERLQLERHLQIANDSLQRNNGVDLQKYISLEQSNNYLRQQLDSLDLLQQEHKLVEIQYREKEEACRYTKHFCISTIFPINGLLERKWLIGFGNEHDSIFSLPWNVY